MIIFKNVTSCDFTEEQYDTPVAGIAVIAQGATGRWCEVMWGGPSILEQEIADGTAIYCVDVARAKVNAMEDSYADF